MKIKLTWENLAIRQFREFEVSELDQKDLVNLVEIIIHLAGKRDIQFNLDRSPSSPETLEELSSFLSKLNTALLEEFEPEVVGAAKSLRPIPPFIPYFSRIYPPR